MATATVTSKGQITIPSAVRSDLHLEPGDRVEFVKADDGRYELVPAAQDVRVLRGMVKAKRSVTVDEMNAAIRKRAQTKHK